MKRLTATLVAEGSSDQALVPFMEFLLDEYCDVPYSINFATGLPSGALPARIAQAMVLYPCDMLFIHRDADRTSVPDREREIRNAVAISANNVKLVSIIPVRMTEAWLLVDDVAIRRAAGNPVGRIIIDIPSIARLESLADPKEALFKLLCRASELSPQRLRRFDKNQARRQVSGFMDNYEILRRLPSFMHFEAQVRSHFSSPT